MKMIKTIIKDLYTLVLQEPAEQGDYIQVTIQIQILGMYNTNTEQQVDMGEKTMEIPNREIIIHLFEDRGVNRIYLGPVLTEFIIQ